jgi:hypothetical protein
MSDEAQKQQQRDSAPTADTVAAAGPADILFAYRDGRAAPLFRLFAQQVEGRWKLGVSGEDQEDYHGFVLLPHAPSSLRLTLFKTSRRGEDGPGFSLSDNKTRATLTFEMDCFVSNSDDRLRFQLIIQSSNGADPALTVTFQGLNDAPGLSNYEDFARRYGDLLGTFHELVRILNVPVNSSRAVEDIGFRFDPDLARIMARLVETKQGSGLFVPQFARAIKVRAANTKEIKPFKLDVLKEEWGSNPTVNLQQSFQFEGDDPPAGSTPDRLAAAPSEWLLTAEGIPSGSVRRLWNSSVTRPYLAAITTVEGGRPLSLVPEWTEWPSEQRWLLVVKIDVPMDVPASEEEELFARIARSLQPIGVAGKKARGNILNLLTHGGEAVPWAGVIANRHLNAGADSRRNIERERGIVFDLLAQPDEGAQPRQVRMGALDFELNPSTVVLPGASPEYRLRSRLSARFERRAIVAPPVTQTPFVSIEAELGVTDVAPGSQDELPGEEYLPEGGTPFDLPQGDRDFNIEQKFKRDLPLVIPVNSGAGVKPAAGATRFTLAVQESSGPTFSQTMRMRLRTTRENADQTPKPVLIVDRHPFLVALVEVPPFLGQTRGTGSDEVGHWSNSGLEGAGWELQGSTDGFSLYLPPQVVGEAMERGQEGAGFTDIEEGRAINFRFSPPARFTLLPSFFKQRFAEAPWNLRRLLGFPGQRAPGAGVESLRFELLYGMTCRVDYKFLRLAEISSRLGHIPGRLPQALESQWQRATDEQKSLFQRVRESWADSYSRYLSRLSILEPWDTHQPASLTLTEDLHYQLRQPFDPATREGSAKLRFTLRGDKPGDPVQHVPPLPADPEGLKQVLDLLPGGVGWGIEFGSIRDALYREPKSVSAKLVAPYFSALGGWGYQQAKFHKGLIAVYSNTAMGRCFYYSLEVTGRINNFWNRAKYVVVYERTVQRAVQFENQQDELRNRPVLRKVREYVEITQPVRHYPEYGAAPVTRGFVNGCEFKKTVIPVDSGWGTNVPNEFFTIPIWQPSANQAIFPKPHLMLEVAADPAGGSPTQSVVIEEPEKLVFYANMRADANPNPDLWASVLNVDFADQPTPAPPQVATHHAGNLDASLPEAEAVHAGFGAFTYAVAPAERLTNLVAERTDDALGAVLRNVTMMRARGQAALEGEGARFGRAAQALTRATDHGRSTIQGLLSRLPTDQNSYAALRAKLGGELSEMFGAGRNRFDAEVTAFNGHVGGSFSLPDPCASLGAALDIARQRWDAWFRERLGELEDPISQRLDAATEVNAELRRALREQLQSWLIRLGAIFQTFQTGLEDVQLRVDRSADAVLEVLTRLRAHLSAEADALTTAVEALFGSLNEENRRLVIAQLDSAADRLITAVREIEKRLSALAQGPLAKYRVRIRQLALQIEGSVARSRDELRGPTLLGAPLAQLALLRTEILARLGDLRRLSETTPFTELEQFLREDVRGRLLFKDQLWALNGWHKTLEGELLRHFDATDLGQEPLVELRRRVAAAFTNVRGAVGANLTAVSARAVAFCGALVQQLEQTLDRLLPSNQLQALLGALPAQLGDLRRSLEGHLRQFGDAADQLTAVMGKGLSDAAGRTLSQLPDNTMRLIRAWGDAPKVPNLGFNRDRLAYFFDEARKNVDITPVTALVNRAGQELKALGLRVPTRQILDRCIPDQLQNLQLSQILPDWAGVRLDNLFPGLRMPALANNNVKVTQGVDKQSMRAWLQTEVDVPVDEPTTLFSFGPVMVRLLNARFSGFSRIDAGVTGGATTSSRGSISGNWELQVGGLPIVTFRDTALRFEQGRGVRFDLSPDRVEVQGFLRFLSDLMAKFGYSDSGLTIRLAELGGLPAGVESVLDLPLPDVQFGAFGLSNLRLGANLGLLFRDEAGFNFTLSVHFFLGQKTAPFALSIFILAGGGWVDVKALYKPLLGQIQTAVTIGIVAGARIGFAFGPVKGEVAVFFGISAEFASGRGVPNRGLALTVMLLIRGELNLLGYISVNVTLLLEAEYRSDGSLTGRGTLSLKIKICWCFTIKVSTRVEYKFRQGSGGARALDAVERLVQLTASHERYRRSARAYIGKIE